MSLKNETDNKIRYIDKIMNINDTLLEYCDSTWCGGITPNNREILYSRSMDRWEYVLRDKPEKILRIYIISEDTFKKYSICDYIDGKMKYYRKKDTMHNYDMCDVFKHHLFLKRFDLKYEDLVKADWEIVYDGK